MAPEDIDLIGLLLLTPIVCWLPTRLSLLLPAIAVRTDSVSFAQEWKRTRGSFWKIFCGLVICGLPTIFFACSFGVLLSVGLDTAMMSSKLVEVSIGSVIAAIIFLSEVAGIGYLSIVYRELSDTDQIGEDVRQT